MCSVQFLLNFYASKANRNFAAFLSQFLFLSCVKYQYFSLLKCCHLIYCDFFKITGCNTYLFLTSGQFMCLFFFFLQYKFCSRNFVFGCCRGSHCDSCQLTWPNRKCSAALIAFDQELPTSVTVSAWSPTLRTFLFLPSVLTLVPVFSWGLVDPRSFLRAMIWPPSGDPNQVVWTASKCLIHYNSATPWKCTYCFF